MPDMCRADCRPLLPPGDRSVCGNGAAYTQLALLRADRAASHCVCRARASHGTAVGTCDLTVVPASRNGPCEMSPDSEVRVRVFAKSGQKKRARRDSNTGPPA